MRPLLLLLSLLLQLYVLLVVPLSAQLFLKLAWFFLLAGRRFDVGVCRRIWLMW